MGHSRLAASASSRWILCPGSVAYIEWLRKEGKISEDTSGPAAERGTAVHNIIEHAIIKELAPELMGSKLINKLAHVELEPGDLRGAEICYQYVENIKGDYDEIHAERKYDLSWRYDIDLGGTADISCFEWGGLLHIGDYKNGRTYVNAENNSQMRIYALGAYHHVNDDFDFQDVKTTIIQPNAKTKLGPIRSDDFTVGELLHWEEKTLVPAVELIAKNTAQLNPGKVQCTWCPARHVCEANAKDTFALAQIDFANVAEPKPTLPTPNSLTKEQLTFIIENSDRMRKFLEACEKHVYEQCEKYDNFGDYHLENKFGNRRYIADKDVRKKLRTVKLTVKELMIESDPKMMTVTQLESYLKTTKKWSKEKIQEFMETVTEKPVTGQQLVRNMDTAEKDFSNLETSKKSKTKKTQKIRRPR